MTISLHKSLTDSCAAVCHCRDDCRVMDRAWARNPRRGTRRRQSESRRRLDGVIKVHGQIRVDRDGGYMKTDRPREGNAGRDQRITAVRTDGASEHPSFILPCTARTDARSRTRSQLASLCFSLFANSLLLFPGATCYPSPDFGIKVLPSSSTSNLLSSLFFHYTSPFPL